MSAEQPTNQPTDKSAGLTRRELFGLAPRTALGLALSGDILKYPSPPEPEPVRGDRYDALEMTYLVPSFYYPFYSDSEMYYAFLEQLSHQRTSPTPQQYADYERNLTFLSDKFLGDLSGPPIGNYTDYLEEDGLWDNWQFPNTNTQCTNYSRFRLGYGMMSSLQAYNVKGNSPQLAQSLIMVGLQDNLPRSNSPRALRSGLDPMLQIPANSEYLPVALVGKSITAYPASGLIIEEEVLYQGIKVSWEADGREIDVLTSAFSLSQTAFMRITERGFSKQLFDPEQFRAVPVQAAHAQPPFPRFI